MASSRQNIQRARPNTKATRPNIQGARPNILAARPNMQGARPNIQGARPNIHGASPNIQGARPNIQGARPNIPGARPNIQGARSNIQGARPNIQGARPNIQGASKELKEYLIGFYRKHHSKIQVSPLVEGNDVDLVEFYVESPMTAIDLQRKIGNPQKSPVKIGKQLFYRDGRNAFKNIYVTAGPGLGKTSLSQRICMAWCQAHKPLRSIAGKFQPDEVLALKDFNLLFLIPLRDAHKSQCDLDEIIRAYLPRHLPRSHYLDMLDIIFNECSCLILLDGMDEWYHPESCTTGDNAQEIPHRKFRKNWTILTTTRPWKFDEIRLASHQIDRHIEINELDEETSHQLVINGVRLLNQSLPKDKQKSVEDFYKTLSLIKLGEIRNVPYIYLQCVCLWFEEKDIGKSKSEIYVNVIELTLRRGIEKIKSGLSLPPAQADSGIHVPKCIMGTRYCKQHLPLLLKLGKLAFYALFDVENRQRLVLDVTFAMKYLEQYEMEFCLKLGLLSQNKIYGLLSERVSNVSFMHKSIQECFAALYMQSYNRIGEVKNIVVQNCTSLSSILNMSNVFIFLSGFRRGVYSELCSLIMQRASDDENINKYRTRLTYRTTDPEYGIMFNFQTMQVDCVEEMLANGHEFSNLPVEDILIDEETKHETYTSVLHKLVHGNQGNIKSLSIRDCENTEEVTQILETLDLQYLHSLYKLDLRAVARQPDVEQLLRQSMSTLHYLHLCYNIYEQGLYFSEMTVLSKVCEEIILGMPLLKSLCLDSLIVTHNQLENVTTFLTSRVTMIQIYMISITCSDHDESCPCVQFNLSGHDNLQLLGLIDVPVSQLQMNTQHLEECSIGELSSSVITSCLTSLPAAHNLHILQCSNITDSDIPTLITTVPALSQLEKLYIHYTDLTDNRLDLTDMTRLQYIELYNVTMTSSALRALSLTVTALSQSVTVVLYDCTVTPEVEYETVKEEIRESDILTITFDGQGNYYNEFSFIKETCLK